MPQVPPPPRLLSHHGCFEVQNLFCEWMRSRDTVGDAHERCPGEPCSGGRAPRGHASGELPGECRNRSALGAKRPSTPGVRWKRSDRVVPGLCEIHEVAGRRHLAKQVLRCRSLPRPQLTCTVWPTRPFGRPARGAGPGPCGKGRGGKVAVAKLADRLRCSGNSSSIFSIRARFSSGLMAPLEFAWTIVRTQ